MRLRPTTAAVLASAALFGAAPAKACLWDSDTIAEERAKFPTAMEILAGKYNRHSPVFYEWRIKDRQTKLEKDPNNCALLDDLGVALLKTGKIKEAVEVGEREVALDPKRYESQSNLGTYYIFAGDLDKSAEHIQAALAINPDAHFGREKYQLYLVEYMRDVKKARGSVSLPLRAPTTTHAENQTTPQNAKDFNMALAQEVHSTNNGLSDEERRPAIKGILGMMRFANDELPVLNEALGDLMNFTFDQRADKQLAARAYLKAAAHVPNAAIAEQYDRLAAEAMQMQDNTSYEILKKDFAEECAQGKAWMAQIAADETQWIAEGKDPEVEFDAKYRSEPEVTVRPTPFWQSLSPLTRFLIQAGITLVVLCVALWLAVLSIRHLFSKYITPARSLAAGRAVGRLSRRVFPSFFGTKKKS